MSEWLPIETLPRDGRKVLLVCDLKAGQLIWIGSSRQKYGNGSGEGKPTHWQPLPDPPVSSSTKSKEEM
jgi:hypothetical protein